MALPTSPRPSTSESAPRRSSFKASTTGKGWDIRRRLSSAAGRPLRAEYDDCGVDDEIWDKNEAAFLRETALQQAPIASQSSHGSVASLSPRSHGVRSPLTSHLEVVSPRSSRHEARSYPHYSSRLSLGPEFHLNQGFVLNARQSAHPASQRGTSSRPASRASTHSHKSRQRDSSQVRQLDDAIASVSVATDGNAYSPLTDSGVSSASGHHRAGPGRHHEAQPGPTPARCTDSTLIGNDSADPDQTILSLQSPMSDQATKDPLAELSRRRQKSAGMQSFLSTDSIDSQEDLGRPQNYASTSRVTLDELAAAQAMPPPPPPKERPMELGTERRSSGNHSTLRPVKSAHPFLYSNPSSAQLSVPQDFPDVVSTASKSAVALTTGQTTTDRRADPRTDDDEHVSGRIIKNKSPKGFFRSMRSRETSATSLNSDVASPRDKESPRLVEGLRKLIRKEKPSIPASSSSRNLKNGSDGTSPRGSPLIDGPWSNPDAGLSSSRHGRAGSVSSHQGMHTTNLPGTSPQREDRCFVGTSRAPVPQPTRRTSVVEQPMQLLRPATTRSRSRTTEGNFAPFFPAEGAVLPASVAGAAFDNAQHVPVSDSAPAAISRKLSASSSRSVLSGRSRRASRADSLAREASVIEHVSYDEARRRSGQASPMILHNGISVADLRTESLRRGSIGSQLPPAAPTRPHRGIPPKAERLLGMSTSPHQPAAQTTQGITASSSGTSLMDRFNDSHSVRWNTTRPWETVSRNSHTTSSTHSRSLATPFTPTASGSDSISLFSAVPDSVTSSISSYARSERSMASKASRVPRVDPLAASFALTKQRRSSGSSGGMHGKKRWASIFGMGGGGRTPSLASSNISRPVSVAGSTLSEGPDSFTTSSSCGNIQQKARQMDNATMSPVAMSKQPVQNAADDSSREGSLRFATSPQQRSLPSSAHQSRSEGAHGGYGPHIRSNTAPFNTSIGPRQANSSSVRSIASQESSNGAYPASEGAVRSSASHDSQTQLAGHPVSSVGPSVVRRPSLNEQLLSPVMDPQGTAARARRPSADSVFAASRGLYAYKRPTFGLDLQPDAAAAFDSIPSPHIVKSGPSTSKASSLASSRRDASHLRSSAGRGVSATGTRSSRSGSGGALASGSVATRGSSLRSGIETRPTSQDGLSETPPSSFSPSIKSKVDFRRLPADFWTEGPETGSIRTRAATAGDAQSYVHSHEDGYGLRRASIDAIRGVIDEDEVPTGRSSPADHQSEVFDDAVAEQPGNWVWDRSPEGASGYAQFEQPSERVEILEDILEHPHSSPASMRSYPPSSPEIEGSMTRSPTGRALMSPGNVWGSTGKDLSSTTVIHHEDPGRPSISSARSFASDATSIQGIPQSVHSERSDSIWHFAIGDGDDDNGREFSSPTTSSIPSSPGMNSIAAFAARSDVSPVLRQQAEFNSSNSTTVRAAPQVHPDSHPHPRDVVDARSFDWL